MQPEWINAIDPLSSAFAALNPLVGRATEIRQKSNRDKKNAIDGIARTDGAEGQIFASYMYN